VGKSGDPVNRRIFKRLVLSLFFAFCALGASSASTAWGYTPALGNYEVVVLPIVTGLGNPGVTETNSRNLISRLSVAYGSATNGKITFTLKAVLPAASVSTDFVRNNKLDVVKQIYNSRGLYLDPDPGFAGLIVVGVIPYDKTMNDWAGLGDQPGQFVILNGGWSDDAALGTLGHEIGHNFGLAHSNTLQCPSNSKVLACAYPTEYSDQSDPMGNYMISYYSSPALLRFSALNLDRLGVLSPNQKIDAITTGTFSLTPVYGQDKSGLRLIYLPVNNAETYAIEYRPAVGLDKLLSASRMAVKGSKAFWTLTPSFGVQIRLIASQQQLFGPLNQNPNVSLIQNPDLLNSDSVTSSTDWSTEPSALLTVPGAKQQGLLSGQSYVLSDGSKVTVLSEDPIKGALVVVTRPSDVQAPAISKPTISWDSPNSSGCPVAQIDTPSPQSSWPSIQINGLTIVENRKIATVILEVNGALVAANVSQDDSGKYNLTYTPHTIGTFHVRVLATDTSGNGSASPMVDISSEPTPDPASFISWNISNQALGGDTCDNFTMSYSKNELISWPSITAAISADDWTTQGLTSAKMKINGSDVVATASIDGNGAHIFTYDTSAVGVFTGKLVWTASGSKSGQTDPRIFTVSTYQLMKPWSIQTSSGTTSDGAITIDFQGVSGANGENVSYTLTTMSGGSISKNTNSNGSFEFIVTGVPIGVPFTANLVGTDSDGNSDGGSTISFTSKPPICTNSSCFVGMKWSWTPPFFYGGMTPDLLTIQEKVAGAWIPTIILKATRVQYAPAKYPYSFLFTKSFTSSGYHLYRYFLGSSYKTGDPYSGLFEVTIAP